MFKPEMNPLAPKPSGPRKPEKELVEIWLGKEAAAEMDEKPETGDEDLKMGLDQALVKKEKKTLWEMKRPDEVTLRNVPQWEKLPDEETLKKDFKLQQIWMEYREGRPLSDFRPRPEETPPSFQGIETLPYAKVFDITDVIAKARRKNPEHPDSLTHAEVLEVIDAAGYRPATLEELFAYSRDYWKPDADPKNLTKAERELQNPQTSFIYGLNSVFSDSDGDRWVSCFRWFGDMRRLGDDKFEGAWSAPGHFLVLRKAFPS